MFESKTDKIVLENYGLKMELVVRQEKRPVFERRFVMENGDRLNLEQVEELKSSGKVSEGAIAKVEWEKADPQWVGGETESVLLYDEELFADNPAQVWYFGTSDGPIITTLPPIEDNNSEYLTFMDPAHVQYTQQGNINLVPIFGVARTMEMHKSAVKQRVSLSPVMAEVYMQFIMQNRQFKYELRPTRPMATTPPMEIAD